MIDLVILDDPRTREFTLQAERTAGVKATWVTPQPGTPFNYNQAANIGARAGSADWIVIANNDLIFTPGWVEPLLEACHPLVSPKCPNDKRQRDITRNEIGDQVGRHFSGWCFMISRKLYEQIGGFDEDFTFWCADNAVVEQCKSVGVLPMLVPGSQVIHLGSQTLKLEPVKDELTRGNVLKFNRKYNKNLFGWGK